MYALYFKRPLDFLLSLMAIIVLSPVLLILTVLGAVIMEGNPFFVQPRPGKKDHNGQEKIFHLIKFRSMNNRKDKDGNLLPDEQRLTKYGKFIRSTSLDELPELINIIKGDMSIVGPRPQLVRDMVFMTADQRRRHTVRQGLTGLAQCSGRNGISWERKLEYDLEYIENITLWNDVKIIFKTVKSVFVREGITEENVATASDFGDYLLLNGKIDRTEYDREMAEAEKLTDAFAKV
jgi:lipopolysaccharide/colanic/teichoic acid biosynthesis glycosyltransferase